MKLIFFLLLISCGNHQEPKSVDLKDSDGDQIINQHETEFERYTANFETLQEVKGIAKHAAFPNGEISFSNGVDTKVETIKLITGEIGGDHKDYYFSESAEIKLKIPPQLSESSANLNILHLYFYQTQTPPEEVLLVEGEAIRSLGKWNSYMNIQLSKDEFNKLLKNRIKIILRKKFKRARFFESDSEDSIRKKTYKVNIHDGEASKILYIAHALPFDNLLEHLGVVDATEVTNEYLFFDSTKQEHERWFYRNYGNGNKAIYFGTLQELREYFYERFERKILDLIRDNGVAKSSFVIENTKNKIVFLKVRPLVKTSRTFEEYTETTKHRSGSAYHGSDDAWTCTHHLRKVKEESTTIPQLEDFFSNLNVKFELDIDMKVNEQIDERGFFWEIMFLSSQDRLHFSLTELKSSTFTTLGKYGVDCQHRGGYRNLAAAPANIEGKLSFEIESFVEKIEK